MGCGWRRAASRRRADGCPDAGSRGSRGDTRRSSTTPTTRVVALTVVSTTTRSRRRAGRRVRLSGQGHADRKCGRAVRAAAKGRLGCRRVPRRSSSAVRRAGSSREPDPGLVDGLSARELDVLRLIAQGHGERRHSRELGISPRTAKNHVSNILAKLGLPSRIQAAIYAVRRGFGLTARGATSGAAAAAPSTKAEMVSRGSSRRGATRDRLSLRLIARDRSAPAMCPASADRLIAQARIASSVISVSQLASSAASIHGRTLVSVIAII